MRYSVCLVAEAFTLQTPIQVVLRYAAAFEQSNSCGVALLDLVKASNQSSCGFLPWVHFQQLKWGMGHCWQWRILSELSA